jgi:TonB family protein
MWALPADGVADADLVFVRPLILAYAIAAPFPTSFANLADSFINRCTQTVGTAPTVLLREVRRINGSDVVALELGIDDGLESARIFRYLFSNDTETIELVAVGKSAMASDRQAVEDLLDGLVLAPPPKAGTTGPLSYRRQRNERPEPAPERVNDDICPPILRTRVEPGYPGPARRSRETGVAVLEAVIGADGGVSDVMVLKSTREPILDEAAVRAVSQWEYDPATKAGKPVSVYLTVTVNFQLHQDEPSATKQPRARGRDR